MDSYIKSKGLKEDIAKIIRESLNSTEGYDGTAVFSIEKYLHALLGVAATNDDLMVLINNFERMIEDGQTDPITVFESFGRALAPFAYGNIDVKNVLDEMNVVSREHAQELEMFKYIYSIHGIPAVQENIFDRYNEFLADPCDETKLALLDELGTLCDAPGYDQIAMRMILIVNNAARVMESKFIAENVYASKQEMLNKQAEETRRERLTKDIFAKVERMLEDRDNAEQLRQNMLNEKYSLTGIAGKNGLKLFENIKKVLASDAVKNPELKNVLITYSNALRQGAYEERLYETFLYNTSKFSYLLPVDKMRKSIMEVAAKNAENITLTKILEEMMDSSTSYIYVDIIQEDVARYVHEPSPENRIQLRNALMPFAADPYINRMFECIYLDEEKRYTGDIERDALNIKEHIDIIRQNATVTNIYSPVQYIMEGESIFNVHGQYFVRKGNHISALEKKYIPKLDRKFVELCHLCNEPRVQIYEDRIIFRGNEYTATIYEGYVDIAGYREDKESLRRLNEMCLKYENYDTNFYTTCSVLLENFNRIAQISWAKHIVLNSNPDITADIFKLDENLYIATHDNAVMNHTFYRNVNPIFCKNTLNEHMGINVSALFEDMLPNQDKIIMRLNETKNEYEKSIEDYEEAIEKLKDAKKKATDDSIISELEDAISDTEQKLKDVKDEYKTWQENAEESVRDTDDDKDDDEEDDDDKEAKVDDEDVIKEPGSEPIDPDDVDMHRDDLATPLAQTDMSDGITDDQFDDILAGGSGDVGDDEGDIIDTDAIDAEMAGGFVPDDSEEVSVIDTDEIGDEGADNDDIFNTDDELDGDEGDVIDMDTLPIVQDEENDELVIGDTFNEPDASVMDEPDNMETVNAETGEVIDTNYEKDNVPEPTDMFGGDLKNPLGDVVSTYNPNMNSEDFNIVNVSFHSNVMTNTVRKSGVVNVIRPMVASDGAQYTDNTAYNFCINEKGDIILEFGNPDEAIPTILYSSIIMAIKNHPSYETVMKVGEPGHPVNQKLTVANEPKKSWQDEYDQEMTDEDKGIYTIGDETEDDVFDSDIIDTDLINAVPAKEVPATAKFNFDDEDEYSKMFGSEEKDDNAFNIFAPVDELPAEEGTGEEVVTDDAVIDDEEDDYSDIADLFDDDEAGMYDEIIDPVLTYVKDGTEIEFPADNVDDTVIPEDKEEKKGGRLNEERRRKIISIKRI